MPKTAKGSQRQQQLIELALTHQQQQLQLPSLNELARQMRMRLSHVQYYVVDNQQLLLAVYALRFTQQRQLLRGQELTLSQLLRWELAQKSSADRCLQLQVLQLLAQQPQYQTQVQQILSWWLVQWAVQIHQRHSQLSQQQALQLADQLYGFCQGAHLGAQLSAADDVADMLMRSLDIHAQQLLTVAA